MENPITDSLRGHVDRADKMLLAGWALSEHDAAHQPYIQIVQNDRPVVTLKTAFPAPHLRNALALPTTSSAPIYIWRLWLPLTCGIQPGVPLSILFKENGRPLQNGVGRIIHLFDGIDDNALYDLTWSTILVPHTSMTEDKVTVILKVFAPLEGPLPAIQVGNDLHKLKNSEWVTAPDPLGIQKRSVQKRFTLDKNDVLGQRALYVPISMVVDEQKRHMSRLTFHCNLRSIAFPKTLFDSKLLVSDLPNLENIMRVSGNSNIHQYLFSGLTTFVQLDKITTRYFGRRITEFDTVVDWGVGCGRVVRHFWETSLSELPTNQSQNIIGVDIDPVNIEWCRYNMNRYGDFRLLSLEGFDIQSNSVDLIYGISVMTHLSEYHQHLWLGEIHRILRPNACAILTVHGESTYYRPQLIALPFVEKFGFFDGIPDPAIGIDRDTYYRTTYHSRSYLRENWTRQFDIVDIIPIANAFLQDFVVLRKRGEA